MKVYPARERKENVYKQDGRPIVVKTPHFNGDSVYESINRSLEAMGGISKTLHYGDSVLIKPNFNCADPIPLSTSLDTLCAMIEILEDCGVKAIVGEMCGRGAWPTEEVVTKLGVRRALKRYGVEFINFQYDEWIPVEINGDYWQQIHIPRTLYEAEHRILMPNMRCHSSARYSGAMKLSVGSLSPDDREIMHSDKNKTEAMIAEINLACQPDFIVMDGRRSTVGWAGRGEYVYPNVIMTSGDMVAIDTEAYKILKGYPGRNRIANVAVEDFMMIKTGVKHDLGSMDYELIELEGHLATRESSNNDPAALAVMSDL